MTIRITTPKAWDKLNQLSEVCDGIEYILAPMLERIEDIGVRTTLQVIRQAAKTGRDLVDEIMPAVHAEGDEA